MHLTWRTHVAECPLKLSTTATQTSTANPNQHIPTYHFTFPYTIGSDVSYPSQAPEQTLIDR
jgi:hypothetical protein